MSDARWGDPREYGDRDHGDARPRVYDERDRDDDLREGLMRDLDLPRGEERELVVVRDHVYELDGEDSRTLAAVGWSGSTALSAALCESPEMASKRGAQSSAHRRSLHDNRERSSARLSAAKLVTSRGASSSGSRAAQGMRSPAARVALV